jgi:hypothetical protein
LHTSLSSFLTLAPHNTKGFHVLHLLSPHHFLFGHLLLAVAKVFFVQEECVGILEV